MNPARRWLLLGPAALVLVYVVAAGGASLEPHAALGRAAQVLGVAVAATIPGAWLLPALRRGQAPLDALAAALLTLGLSVVAHIVNVCAVKALGVEVTPAVMLGLAVLEGALATWLTRDRPLPLRPMGRSERGGVALIAALVLAWAWHSREIALRELPSYFYHKDPMEGAYPGVDAQAAGLVWQGIPAAPLRDGQGQISASVQTQTELRIFYLLTAQTGARLSITCGDELAVAQVERDVIEEVEEGPVPRYNDVGTAALALRLPLGAGDTATCTYELTGTDARSRLVDFTGRPDEALWDDEQRQGYVLTHYYQLLNIVENIRWARELLAGERWLTINQPPLWSFVYSGVMLYAGESLLPLHLFFFGLVGLIALIGWRLVTQERESPPAWYAALPALYGLSHARIMMASGSANFPDTFYALSAMAALYFLVVGQRVAFVAAAVMAVFSRYAAIGLIVLMLTCAALLDRPRRREVLRSGRDLLTLVAVGCALFALGAALTGRLEEWLEILWFETFPEHFHGDYALASLLPRPPEFFTLLLTYTAYTPLLLVGARGRTGVVALALALSYCPLLFFIDHFPSHYFLPPLALLGTSLTCSLSHWRAPWGALGVAASILALGHWLLFGAL